MPEGAVADAEPEAEEAPAEPKTLSGEESGMPDGAADEHRTPNTCTVLQRSRSVGRQ